MNKYIFMEKKALHLAFLKGAEVNPLPKKEPKKHRVNKADSFAIHKKYAECVKG